MKKLLIIFSLILALLSCSKSEEIGGETMSFDIPETHVSIENKLPITVNGKETTISGKQLLQVGDTLTQATLDHKADYFDQVSTGSLSDYSGYKLIETVPSLDTPVCTMQTKQLEFAAKEFSNVTFIVISNDTPFALQRFCSANGIDNLKVFSDARTREFGKQNKLFLPEYSLLTRSIMIVDKNNTIKYIEYANEVTSELDLMNALAFLKNIKK